MVERFLRKQIVTRPEHKTNLEATESTANRPRQFSSHSASQLTLSERRVEFPTGLFSLRALVKNTIPDKMRRITPRCTMRNKLFFFSLSVA